MHRIKHLFFCFLTLSMLLPLVIACAPKGEPVLAYQETELPDYVYRYHVSIAKSDFLVYENGTDTESFWQSIRSEGVTYSDYFTAQVNLLMRRWVVCLQLFETYDLSLSQDLLDRIDEDIDEKETYRGEEFENDLNTIGINKRELREIYRMNEKVNAVKDYLIGENGTMRATEAQITDYYNTNFMRVKYLVFYTGKRMVKNDKGEFVPQSNLTDAEKAEKKERFDMVVKKAKAGENFDTLCNTYSEYGLADYPQGLLIDKTSVADYYELITTPKLLDSIALLATSSENMTVAETSYTDTTGEVIEVLYLAYRYDTLADRTLLTDAEKRFVNLLETKTNEMLFLQVIDPLAAKVTETDTLADLDILNIPPNRGFNM